MHAFVNSPSGLPWCMNSWLTKPWQSGRFDKLQISGSFMVNISMYFPVLGVLYTPNAFARYSMVTESPHRDDLRHPRHPCRTRTGRSGCCLPMWTMQRLHLCKGFSENKQNWKSGWWGILTEWIFALRVPHSNRGGEIFGVCGGILTFTLRLYSI